MNSGDEEDPGTAIARALGLSARYRDPSSRIEAAFVGKFGRQSDLQAQFRQAAAGGSALLVAPTASGKTEAAAMAALDQTYGSSDRILYIAPTRALINDVIRRLEPGFGALNLDVVGRHGERHATPTREAEAKCVVTTPESLDALLQREEEWVRRTAVLIVDELHQLDGTPRGTQLRALIARLCGGLRRPLRILAISATVADPQATAQRWEVAGDPMAVVRAPTGRMREFTVSLSGVDGLRSWLATSRAPDKVLVFTNSRRRSDEVFAALDGVSDRVLMVHYSSLESSYRKEVEHGLRQLARATCIATSTLELGIDIGDIGAVALIDAPWSSLSMTQRLGRAGRRDDRTVGVAFLADDRSLLRLMACAALSSEASDSDGVEPIHYSVAVQQAISMIGASRRGRITPQILAAAVGPTGIGLEPAASVLSALAGRGILRPTRPDGAYELTVTGERLLGWQQWSNFPEDRAQWQLAVGGRTLAHIGLPARPDSGQVLRFGGRYWLIHRVDRRFVHVRPAKPVANPVEAVYGDSVPMVPAATAAMVRLVLAGEVSVDAVLEPVVMTRLVTLRAELHAALTNGNALIPTSRGDRLLTFAGSRANLLLMAATGGGRADEMGITYPGGFSEFRGLTAEGVLKAAQTGWKALGRQLPVTQWFQYLTPALQRFEVMSWLRGPGVVEAIRGALERPTVPLSPSTEIGI